MSEGRDRLSRQEDVLATFSNRRAIISSSNGNVGRVNSDVFVREDEAEGQATRTPFRWRGTAMVGTPAPVRLASTRGTIGTSRLWRSPNFGRSSPRIVGRENMSPMLRSGYRRGGGRGRGSAVLPAWYPRKPLQDITAVARAFERRRARLREGDGLQTESSILQDQTVHDPSVSTSVAQLEQDNSMISPHPTIGIRRLPPTIGKVPKILLNITNQDNGDSACLTPQKKLLNSIDTVGKVVMEELHKLKRTPAAKRAERDKRVRTLMSMR